MRHTASRGSTAWQKVGGKQKCNSLTVPHIRWPSLVAMPLSLAGAYMLLISIASMFVLCSADCELPEVDLQHRGTVHCFK